MGIKHSDVKVSGEKGFAAEWNKNHDIDGDVDMLQNSWENQVIENLAAFPAGPVEGQIVYRSDLNKLYIWDGAAWAEFLDDNNYTDFVAIPKGTYYWSCNGSAFSGRLPDTNDVVLSSGKLAASADGISTTAPVYLPHGAVVVSAIVRGNGAAAAEVWSLKRIHVQTGVTSTLATENINTEDNGIANATISNSNYGYYLETSSIDTGDEIYSAIVVYTL